MQFPALKALTFWFLRMIAYVCTYIVSASQYV